jgi:hypothetical protein
LYTALIIFIVPQAVATNFATLIVTRIFTGSCSAVLSNATSAFVRYEIPMTKIFDHLLMKLKRHVENRKIEKLRDLAIHFHAPGRLEHGSGLWQPCHPTYDLAVVSHFLRHGWNTNLTVH